MVQEHHPLQPNNLHQVLAEVLCLAVAALLLAPRGREIRETIMAEAEAAETQIVLRVWLAAQVQQA